MDSWKGIAIGLVGVVAACAGWLVTDALEANNDFCTACHLPSGAVLHVGIREGFDARPVHNLAGAHGSSKRESEAGDRNFRCIDCHGGVGWLGRAKVKLLAAKDAMVWLTGDFDEPDHMQYPLGEADCRQCHTKYALDIDADDLSQRFHNLSVHNADLGVLCVECHTVHDGGDDSATFYLDTTGVRQQCARCHSEYQEAVK